MLDKSTVAPSSGASAESVGSRYSGTSSESKQMLHPRCTERLLSSKPEAPPSSNNALVFWNRGSTTLVSSTCFVVCASGGSSVATARVDRRFFVVCDVASPSRPSPSPLAPSAPVSSSSSTVATLFMPPSILKVSLWNESTREA